MNNKKLVLVIDDDPDILESIKAILNGNGYDTTTALTGEEGLKAFKSQKPDFILCDMMMEKIDEGISVASAIKQLDGTIPIFLLSSIANATANNIELNKIGFNGVFQKPVDPPVMLSVIAKQVNK